MGHKILVDGADYAITGGATLIDGTSYSVKNGKTLVDNVKYDILFSTQAVVQTLWEGNYFGRVRAIEYNDGYWVAGGRRTGADGNYYACIAYSTKLEGPWTVKDVWFDGEIHSIAYGDGYWVALGIDQNSYSHFIAYTTSLNSDWTTKTIQTSAGNSSVSVVKFANGYWTVGGCYTTDGPTYYAYITYATNPGGTWTKKNIWSGNSNVNCVQGIEYADGYWVICGGYRQAAGSNNYSRIAYATSLGGDWTTKNLYEQFNNPTNIVYANGYWTITGLRLKSSSPYDGIIAYAEIPGGQWTITTAFKSRENPRALKYLNGYICMWSRVIVDRVDSYGIICSTKQEGPWAIKEYSTTKYPQIYSMTYGNGYWVFGGVYGQIVYGKSLDAFQN